VDPDNVELLYVSAYIGCSVWSLIGRCQGPLSTSTREERHVPFIAPLRSETERFFSEHEWYSADVNLIPIKDLFTTTHRLNVFRAAPAATGLRLPHSIHMVWSSGPAMATAILAEEMLPVGHFTDIIRTYLTPWPNDWATIPSLALLAGYFVIANNCKSKV